VQSTIDLAAQERDLNSTSLLTVTIALGTITMTFGALIAVFFIRAEKNMLWGHVRIPSILWATTGLLMASSVTLEGARRRLRRDDRAGFFRLTAWTTALAGLFLAGQLTAWFQILHSGIVLAGNPHAWFIFLFSGLHGLHIVLGLGGLIYLLARTREAASGPKYQMKTRAIAKGVSIFWHYLDFLWVVLFTLLLTWRR
jgi:cytochrome c oxidase subunit 3